jgi:hypothetical protein
MLIFCFASRIDSDKFSPKRREEWEKKREKDKMIYLFQHFDEQKAIKYALFFPLEDFPVVEQRTPLELSIYFSPLIYVVLVFWL